MEKAKPNIGNIEIEQVAKMLNMQPKIKTTKRCIIEAFSSLIIWLEEPCKEELHFPEEGRDHYIRYVKGQYTHRKYCPICWKEFKESIAHDDIKRFHG